jgi:DNA-3-methyladenine glycosylase I
MVKYHDNEWGVPSKDDGVLFEMLSLGGAQAGLSWSTILKRRKHYRDAFAGFDPSKVARFTKKKRDKLVQNAGIIRNKLKIESTINNAKAVLMVQSEFGTLSDFIWAFVDHKPIQNRWISMKEIPTETIESRELSKELKRRGFSFVGPTICYAFMQAVGMVNDHEVGCFRYRQVMK